MTDSALAALVDLDYSAAVHYASGLQAESASGEFDNGDSLLAAAWAQVLRKLALQLVADFGYKLDRKDSRELAPDLGF